MPYGIVRVQKIKMSGIRGIQIHDERLAGHSNTNPDIDFSRSAENSSIWEEGDNETFYCKVKRRLDSLDTKRAIRKDAVVMVQVLITSDNTFFEGKSRGEIIDFFQNAGDFLEERFGEENIISSTIHFDEHTPHMHMNFVPVTADGRLCAKEIITPKQLRALHDDFYKQVGKKYGLKRGEPESAGKRRKHYETAIYKEVAEGLKQAEEARQTLQKAQKSILSLKEDKPSLKEEIAVLGANKRFLEASGVDIPFKRPFFGAKGELLVKEQDLQNLEYTAKIAVGAQKETEEERKKRYALEDEIRRLTAEVHQVKRDADDQTKHAVNMLERAFSWLRSLGVKVRGENGTMEQSNHAYFKYLLETTPEKNQDNTSQFVVPHQLAWPIENEDIELDQE